jgi:hypothetical protein
MMQNKKGMTGKDAHHKASHKRERPTANRKLTKNFASHLSNFLYIFSLSYI